MQSLEMLLQDQAAKDKKAKYEYTSVHVNPVYVYAYTCIKTLAV